MSERPKMDPTELPYEPKSAIRMKATLAEAEIEAQAAHCHHLEARIEELEGSANALIASRTGGNRYKDRTGVTLVSTPAFDDG